METSSYVFSPHFRLHKQQEMDILAIYCAVDSEGNKTQYFKRGSCLLKTNPTKEIPVMLCNRIFNFLCRWSNSQVNGLLVLVPAWDLIVGALVGPCHLPKCVAGAHVCTLQASLGLLCPQELCQEAHGHCCWLWQLAHSGHVLQSCPGRMYLRRMLGSPPCATGAL